MEEWLQNGADPNDIARAGSSFRGKPRALQLHIEEENIDIFPLLLENGVDPNMLSVSSREPALHVASLIENRS